LSGKTSTPSDAGPSDDLKALGDLLSDPCLKSSTRILILISLALNKKLGFTDLLHLTGIGKGSLSNHLEKLEAAGYVKTRRLMIFGGHRIVIEITERGIEAYDRYVTTVSRLRGGGPENGFRFGAEHNLSTDDRSQPLQLL
jgi:DNA-binding MarR family transcriptional regulator